MFIVDLDGEFATYVQKKLMNSQLSNLDERSISNTLDIPTNEHSQEPNEPNLGDREVESVNTSEFNWFDNSELESPLYSNVALSLGNNEAEAEIDGEATAPLNGARIPLKELLFVPTEAEDPLTKTVTVGNPEGTRFTFNFAEDTPQEVIDGVKQAGENWSAVLKDNVELTIDFNYQPIDELFGGVLGVANPNFLALPYEVVKESLATDATSSSDRTAVANLPESEVNYLVNNTAENNGSDTFYLDDNGGLNNANLNLTRANAKALGIGLEDLAAISGLTPEEYAALINAQYGTEVDPNAPDASPLFNSNVNWDFDPSDGIAADATDFVGTVTHELGHGLGFFSDAEVLDFLSVASINDVVETSSTEETQQAIADSGLESLADSINVDTLLSENEYFPTTFDLFRFSPESFEEGARDFTTNNIEGKYFSLDGGETQIAPLAEGLIGELNVGGFSHWQDNLNLGLMDPIFLPGELEQISENDLLALDAVGWDVV